MGSLFSTDSNNGKDDDTVKTEDFIPSELDLKTNGGYSRNADVLRKHPELNNTILKILNTETIKEGGANDESVNKQNINNKILNILNSVTIIKE